MDTQGRGRALTNCLPGTLGQLRGSAENLVDIHGQHANQSLLKASSQRDMLDSQGGHHALAADVRNAWQDWQQADKALRAATQNANLLEQERERLAWQVAELDRLGLHAGEWEQISNHHNRLAHAKTLQERVSTAARKNDGKGKRGEGQEEP